MQIFAGNNPLAELPDEGQAFLDAFRTDTGETQHKGIACGKRGFGFGK
jgi:hypothetical protein